MKLREPGFVVAIDGTAGSGKSTTAKASARRLGFDYMDTGAMYRAMTLKVLETGTRITDKAGMARLLRATRIDLSWCKGRLWVKLDRRDVTSAIRTPEVTGYVSEVSAVPAVRDKMKVEQRRAALGRNLVCEGRDIGSVVFPDAGLKVYLDCDVPERAARRVAEWREDGMRTSRTSVTANLRRRDRLDSGRKVAPLVRVADAVLLDTTMLTIEEQVEIVCSLVRRRLALMERA
ncbi:MAG: (d)CMP kinase [candidate division WOR-3 bacterium]|nr:MAG: (d)CMP kinase [candidate division WOR-3 bacterium]